MVWVGVVWFFPRVWVNPHTSTVHPSKYYALRTRYSFKSENVLNSRALFLITEATEDEITGNNNAFVGLAWFYLYVYSYVMYHNLDLEL